MSGDTSYDSHRHSRVSEGAERDAELIDLVRLSVRDHFGQRKLVRQLEDLADQIAERLRPVYEHDFRTVPENERVAALLAVVDALEGANLTRCNPVRRGC